VTDPDLASTLRPAAPALIVAIASLLAFGFLTATAWAQEAVPESRPAPFGEPADEEQAGPGIRMVVLDPGHGGDEVGAIGRLGVMEKNVALDLARRLRRKLEANHGLHVLLTREDDRMVPLRQRTAIANNAGADLFLSIHLNSSRRLSAHGTETYFLALTASDAEAMNLARIENLATGGIPDVPPPDAGVGERRRGEAAAEEDSSGASDLEMVLWGMAQSEHLVRSSRLAELIQDEMNRLLGIESRGVKQAPFTVLMGATMPAVLVEVAFLSNQEDEEMLLSSEFLDRVAEAMESAIIRHKREYERATTAAPSGPAP
jgi:N-acetylmuramoyl-L-alanine amidase